MGTRALPDIHALALERCAPLSIVHIYQATHSCLCYNLRIHTYIHLRVQNPESVTYYGVPFVSKLLHETWIQKTKFDSIYISFIQKSTRFLCTADKN